MHAALIVVLGLAVPDAAVEAAADAGAASADAGAASADAGALAPVVTDEPPPVRHMTAAVAGSQPFVTPLGEDVSGMSVAVWREVAQPLNIEFELVHYDQVSEALDAVVGGEADIAVGPISITSARAKRVDFTQPYFQAKVGIITRADTASAWDRLRPIMAEAFSFGLVTLLLVLMGVGMIVWLAERRANPDHFPSSPIAGVGNGMWFALVTMTTVGYGDRAPVTRVGRFVTAAWMLIGVVAMSSVTAGIATALTLSQIDEDALSDLDALRRERVAAVEGTPGLLVARRHGAQIVATETKEAALDLVERGKVAAMVYDHPVLQHYVQTHPETELAVFETAASADNYGFALPKGSPLLEELDVAILQLRESAEMEAILNQWLSN